MVSVGLYGLQARPCRAVVVATVDLSIVHTKNKPTFILEKVDSIDVLLYRYSHLLIAN
jgi:hypothetical protein